VPNLIRRWSLELRIYLKRQDLYGGSVKSSVNNKLSIAILLMKRSTLSDDFVPSTEEFTEHFYLK